ncbi:molybdate ABC transporter substrate-binding protein [Ilumatobacter nonamiensis]|uniref:molybdate ABC transporter substrate-binding protein n=1 Tax=Ilumatobacter nonamiensis TaxID=467093 RepID=UPI00034AA59F|nr:molybdate ABC transporter substrate-binding protein [Ilumatobacter nonamiensis]
MARITTALATAAVVSVSAVSCGGPDDDPVLVLAAASLTDAFATMETEFEAANPDLDIEVSFGGSSALQVQVEEGAPADVVAFADASPMAALVDDDLVDDPTVFATNALVLVTPADNPGGVTSLDDLTNPDLLVGVCAPQVPCGRYAAELLDRAEVDASLDTQEPDVRSLAAKIAAGELDAGLVYATDVDAFPDELELIPLPDGIAVRAEYPIAAVSESSRPDDAERFLDFVLSAEGRQILADAGFGER